jgi:hypothetical protein
MDAIFDLVLKILGEVALEALAPSFFALVWAAGAFCLMYRSTNGAVAGVAGLAALVFALWLTYLWSKSVIWARNVLLVGALVAVFPAALLLWKPSTP